MKAAIKEMEEIKKVREAINRTDSFCRRQDLYKNYKQRVKDLKEYCAYRRINFKELWEKYK